jgi:hypothetical protein
VACQLAVDGGRSTQGLPRTIPVAIPERFGGMRCPVGGEWLVRWWGRVGLVRAAASVATSLRCLIGSKPIVAGTHRSAVYDAIDICDMNRGWSCHRESGGHTRAIAYDLECL